MKGIGLRGLVVAVAVVVAAGVWFLQVRARDGRRLDEQASAALDVAPEYLTVARIHGSLQLLANIFPNVPGLETHSRGQARQVMVKTATTLAARYLGKDEFRNVQYATVTLVGITSRNEYGNLDLRSLRKYAVVKVRRAELPEPEIVSARVAFDPVTEAAVYAATWAKLNNSPKTVAIAAASTDKQPESLVPPVGAWPAATSEQLLFDEVDLYDHPQFAGDRFRSFAPERVRRNECDYFLTSAGAGAAPGSLGPRFGEVVLRGASGSLVYLPRAIKYEGALALAFSYRKTRGKGRCFVAISTEANRRALVCEGDHVAFAPSVDGQWQRAVIPLSAFVMQSVSRTASTIPPPAPAWDYLAYHRVAPGEVFGIEIGLLDAEAGATLEFDRISLLQPGAATDCLTGEVVPPRAGVKVCVASPDARLEPVTDAEGRFRVQLPATWRRYEVYVRQDGVDYLPDQGRYFDRGSHLTPLRVHLDSDEPPQFSGRTGTVQYFWAEDGRGSHYVPRIHHLHSGNLQNPQEYFTENATNSAGFFDRDRRAANPANAFRILVTGECYAEGSQIDSQERLIAQMEAIARFRHDRPVEVMGLITPMMAFTAAWPAIEKVGLPLRPNLILINIVAPDMLGGLHVEFDAARWGYNPQHPRNTAFALDAATGALRCIRYDPHWDLFVGKGPPPPKLDVLFREFGGVNWFSDANRADATTRPPFLQHTVELLAATLRYFNQEAGKVGAKVALLDSTYAPPNTWEVNGVRYDARAFHALLAEAAAKADTFVIDGAQVLIQRARPRVAPRQGVIHMFEHDGHWSSLAHRLVAEGAMEELEKRGWLGQAAATTPVPNSAGR